MKSKHILRATIALLCTSAAFAANAGDLTYQWFTVVNNGDLIPGTGKFFNSYNQPAVNTHGMVVFRARSRGGEGQPEHGIYIRDMEYLTPARTVFRRNGEVPQPNNSLQPDGGLAKFNEFPSVPRIDAGSDTIATRAQSKPVWVYTLNGSETNVGTAGIYTNPRGIPTTGASLLGIVPGFEYFRGPGRRTGHALRPVPGSPAITERATIVFKGNLRLRRRGGPACSTATCSRTAAWHRSS